MHRDEMMKAIQNIDEKFILNADREFINMKKSTPIKWVAVASIVAVPVVFATAYQAGFLADVLSIFSTNTDNPYQNEYIQEVAKSNGSSVTINGTTLRVDAIMGDTNQAEVVYSITNENILLKLPKDKIDEETGYTITYRWSHNEDLYHVKSSMPLFGYMHGGGLHSDFKENEDGTLTFTHRIDFNKSAKGETIRADFKGIGYNKIIFDGDNFISNEYVPLIEDELNLEYVLDYNESNQITTATQTESDIYIHQDKEILFREIAVSPQSVKVEFFCDEVEVSHEKIDEVSEFFDSIPLYFTKNDGSTINIQDLSGYDSNKHWGDKEQGTAISTAPESMMYVTINILFEEIISLEDIVSITFGDVTTPLN